MVSLANKTYLKVLFCLVLSSNERYWHLSLLLYMRIFFQVSLTSLKSSFAHRRNFSVVRSENKLYSSCKQTEVQKKTYGFSRLKLVYAACWNLFPHNEIRDNTHERRFCLRARLSPNTQTIPDLTKIIFRINIHEKENEM